MNAYQKMCEEQNIAMQIPLIITQPNAYTDRCHRTIYYDLLDHIIVWHIDVV